MVPAKELGHVGLSGTVPDTVVSESSEVVVCQ